MTKRKIYLASSWRNQYQPNLVRVLRRDGHEVYDFRNPEPGNYGFSWSEIDPNWENWDFETYKKALNTSIAEKGFKLDFDAMKWADTGVLLLPSGRSAHIEAGYFVGAGKQLFILNPEGCEVVPELMYKMSNGIFDTFYTLCERLL